jgi:hypothetical protein
MAHLGPEALSTSELLTLVLGTGPARGAAQLAERLYVQ